MLTSYIIINFFQILFETKNLEISNVFNVGTQEDASEFFTTLIESMAKSIRLSMNSKNKNFNFCDGYSNEFTLQNSNLKRTNNINGNNKITTILDDIFSFQFKSRSNVKNF